jgi:hypothetical protein
MTGRLALEKIAAIIELVPDEWLASDAGFDGKSQQREAYLNYFARRLKNSQIFVREAIHARTSHL